MMRLSTLTLLFLLRIVSASIGPTADLHIVNNNIQPDGFTRSYVLQHFSKFSCIKLFCNLVPSLLVLRQRPGHSLDLLYLVQRLGLSFSPVYGPWINVNLQGATFFMNVVNHLTDTTMLTTTSIVSLLLSLFFLDDWHCPNSVALARHVSASHKLGGRSNWSDAMSHHSRQLIFIPVLRPWPGWNLLVPFPSLYVVPTLMSSPALIVICFSHTILRWS